VHISYADLWNNDLKYATNAGGPWVNYTLDTGLIDSETSIEVDSKGEVYIVYYDTGPYDLKLAYHAPDIPEFGSMGLSLIVIASVTMMLVLHPRRARGSEPV
jgi:hypothetical protein